jgi:hypothetical protein
LTPIKNLIKIIALPLYIVSTLIVVMEGVPFAPEVRMIRINGSTFPAPTVGGAQEEPVRRRSRRTRKQDGGGGPNPIDDSIPANPSTIGLPIIPTGPVFITKVAEVAPAVQQTQKGGAEVPSNIPPGPVISGGQTKVVLKKRAPGVAKTKVLLKKKLMIPTAAKTTPSSKTSGKSRKITVKHVGSKIRKTRHAVKHAKELPLDKLRAHLIEKKFIKQSSKAPEPILRQIYTDSLIVSKKTL